MWAWYFILFVLLLMVIVQVISSRRKKPFFGIKALFPQFNEETGAELTPYYKNKSQIFIEKLSKTPLPYFETTINLYQKNLEILVAEWSIGDNFKNHLSQKYGKEFWHNTQPIIRVNHTNAVPEPFHKDINIYLAEKIKEIPINAPGETINCQVGVITETGSFIPFAQSNDVIMPKNS